MVNRPCPSSLHLYPTTQRFVCNSNGHRSGKDMLRRMTSTSLVRMSAIARVRVREREREKEDILAIIFSFACGCYLHSLLHACFYFIRNQVYFLDTFQTPLFREDFCVCHQCRAVVTHGKTLL